MTGVELVERLHDAEVVVSIRERVEFSRALLERLPKLKLLALVGRGAGTIMGARRVLPDRAFDGIVKRLYS